MAPINTAPFVKIIPRVLAALVCVALQYSGSANAQMSAMGNSAHAAAAHVESHAIPNVFSRTATVNGQKVFYREAGDTTAPTIVLLHGFPSSSHMFRDLIPRLADRFHVVAPDYVGFGHSAAPTPSEFSYTFDNLAQTTQGLLDQIGVREAIFYMHDYGGPIGLRLAAAHPERVKGLIVQNANAYMEGVGKPVADVFLPLWKERNAETEAAARGFLKAETTVFQYTAGARSAAALNPDAWTHDQALLDRKGNDAIQLALFVDYQKNVGLFDAWHSYLNKHQPKTLIVWGKGDPLFVPAGAQAYLNDLPKAELVWLDGGHFALEENSGAVANHIKQFFHPMKPVAAAPLMPRQNNFF
ncbi:MAG: alpha/beta hydrolase [Casimicrobium sp.]